MFPLASAVRPKAAGTAGAVGFPVALQEAAGRVVAAVVKNLQAMAGTRTTIEGALVGSAFLSTSDLAASHRPEAAAALIECTGRPCRILATLDPTLVHALVELVCGGTGLEPLPGEARASTAIDQQYAQMLVMLAATAIQSEWASHGFETARTVKLESRIDADVCGVRVPRVGVVSIGLVIFGLRGTLSLALPPAALDAFADAAPDQVAPENVRDAGWAALFTREIGRAPVRVEAYIEAQALPLGTIAELKVGQVLALSSGARAQAALVCDERTLYRGEVGQADERYSVRIDDLVEDLSTNLASMPKPRRRAPSPSNLSI